MVEKRVMDHFSGDPLPGGWTYLIACFNQNFTSTLGHITRCMQGGPLGATNKLVIGSRSADVLTCI